MNSHSLGSAFADASRRWPFMAEKSTPLIRVCAVKPRI